MRTRMHRKCEERDGNSLNLMDQFGGSNSPAFGCNRVIETETFTFLLKIKGDNLD